MSPVFNELRQFVTGMQLFFFEFCPWRLTANLGLDTGLHTLAKIIFRIGIARSMLLVQELMPNCLENEYQHTIGYMFSILP